MTRKCTGFFLSFCHQFMSALLDVLPYSLRQAPGLSTKTSSLRQTHDLTKKSRAAKRFFIQKGGLYVESTPRILLIGEVANLLRVSVPTINRWLRQARLGQGTFPLPISAKKCKGRWLSTDIDAFLHMQSTSQTPALPDVSSPQRSRKTQSFKQRQDAARAALERHRKTK